MFNLYAHNYRALSTFDVYARNYRALNTCDEILPILKIVHGTLWNSEDFHAESNEILAPKDSPDTPAVASWGVRPEYETTRSEAKSMRKPRLENLSHTRTGRRILFSDTRALYRVTLYYVLSTNTLKRELPLRLPSRDLL